VATAISNFADGWQPAAMRMLENYSVTWGGLGDVLAVPSWLAVKAAFQGL
jgi:hypothetical protein